MGLFGGLFMFHRSGVLTGVPKQEEIEFCALQESAPDAIYTIDPSTLSILGRNRNAAELDGYTDNEIAHMTAADLHPPEDHLLLREWSESGAPAGEVLHLHSLQRKDGQVVPVEEDQTLIDAGGKKIILSIVRAITDYKRAEEALMEERHLLHTLMDNLPDVIYFKDRQSRFTRINKALVEKFGMSDPAEAVGKTDFDFFTEERAQEFYSEEQEIIRTGQPVVDNEEKETWRDGHVSWASTTKMPLRDANGNIIGTFGVSRDITERKRAEAALRESDEKYRVLYESSCDAIMMLAPPEWTFTAGNPAAVALFGATDEQEFITAAPWRLSPEYQPDGELSSLKARQMIDAAMETGSHSFEWTHKKFSGEEFFATVALTRMTYREQPLLQATVRDITARKQAEAEIAERHRLATLVAKVGVALTQAEGLRQGLQQCTEILVRDIGAAFARVWTMNEEQNVLELQASAGRYTHINGGHARIPVGKLQIGCIAESGEPDWTNTVLEDSWGGDKEWARREGMVAFAGYPLKVEGRVLGVVAAFARRPFTKATLQAFASVADNTAQFIKRKRAESELRLTQFSVEHASDAIFWMDPQGRIVYVNEAACRSLERSREELLALSIPDIDPLMPKGAWGMSWDAVKAHGSRVLETQHQTKQGRYFPVEITANYLEFDGKEYSFAFARDITERKRAEQQTHLQTAALESAANGILIASREGRIIWVNSAFTRLTGYPASEVIGGNPRILRSGVHDAVFYQKLWNTILAGEVWQGEIVNRRKDGTLYTEEMTITPVCDAQGALSHFIAIKQDITARKRAEQDLLFKTALLEAESETAIDGILVVDLAGHVLLTNKQFAKMWNIPEEVIRTKDDTKLMERALGQLRDPDSFLKKVGDLYTHESEKSRDEIELKDGRVFDRYSSPLQASTGKLYGRIWYFRDISERREVDRMKSELVSVVSHELRTPLTSIRGALGLLTGGLLRSQPEKGERMLEIAVSNTDRLVRLINDILDLERLESGKMNMEKRTCKAAYLMTQAADSVRDLAEKAGVTLSVSPHSARLWVDPDRIIQALINLLSNAIKFSPRGRTIWLSATPQVDHILFQVKDQGRGIPQEKYERIFERFQQVDASDRREKGGTGLGLPITRSIVQQHGGRIWVESTLGQGSTFSFTLPLLPAKTIFVGDGAGARKLLVCSIEAEVCGAVQAVLKQQGYTVLAAASLQEVTEMGSVESPSAILLDSSWPGMDSLETITALRQKFGTGGVPVIGLGGTAPDEGHLASIGLAGWVTKPVRQDSLLPVLESVLGKLREGPRVLVVEDDIDLARVLTTIFERHGAVVLLAQTGQEAVQVCPQFIPDLLVLDVILPVLDGFGVVEQLRQHEHLRRLPLAVYSVKELDDSEKARLRLGESIFMTKSRLTPQEFEQRAIGLLHWATSGQKERRRQ